MTLPGGIGEKEIRSPYRRDKKDLLFYLLKGKVTEGEDKREIFHSLAYSKMAMRIRLEVFEYPGVT